MIRLARAGNAIGFDLSELICPAWTNCFESRSVNASEPKPSAVRRSRERLEVGEKTEFMSLEKPEVNGGEKILLKSRPTIKTNGNRVRVTKKISSARERLACLKTDQAQRKAYERHMDNFVRELDIIETAHNEGREEDREEVVLTMEEQGLSIEQIASFTNLTPPQVKSIIEKSKGV